MPFIAQELIKGKPSPVTIGLQATLKEASELMVEYDFSQLPVVDTDQTIKGIITQPSILKGLLNFGADLSRVRVQDVADRRPKIYALDDDIFDLIEGLQNQPAVLIGDGSRRLLGIVTSYDTTQYLRGYAEDIMLVSDIEEALKDHIEAVFTDVKTGKLDNVALQTAIDELTDPANQLISNFRKAFGRYSQLASLSHNPKQQWIEEACTFAVGTPSTKKALKDLTLNQYIELFTHKSRWNLYSENFTVGREEIRNLLHNIRETRNQLFHFRGTADKRQRDQLKFCADWLHRNSVTYLMSDAVVPSETDNVESLQIVSLVGSNDSLGHEVYLPMEEGEWNPFDSKYASLTYKLMDIAKDNDKLMLRFEDIESILGFELPPSARQLRSWWANDSMTHVQSRAWLFAGWRVSVIGLSSETVTFSRIRDYEKPYVNFFNRLLVVLRHKAKFTIRDSYPNGNSWHQFLGLPRTGGKQMAMLVFSFARSHRFRVELYIDSGDKSKNKYLFELLQNQKLSLENAIGEELSWERLDHRNASRVALYHPGSITDTEESLTSLQVWAVDAAIRLESVLGKQFDTVMKELA